MVKMEVMKKYFTIIAASVLAFASCQRENFNGNNANPGNGDGALYTYSLNSTMKGGDEPESRMTVATGVNDRYAKWEAGDAIAAFKEGTNVGTATVGTISEDKKYGEFNLTSTAVPGDKVRIIFPSTAEYGKGTLPADLAIASQTAKLLAYTHAYSDEVTLVQDKPLSFSLHHALATVRINYEGGDDWFCEEGTDGSIGTVTLSSTKPLSGDYTVNYETGVVTPGEKVNYYVRSNGRTASIQASGARNYLHFTALPTNGTAEFELRLSVKPKGSSTAIEVPFKFKGELKAGKLNVFNLGTLTLDNVSSASDYYAMWLKGETFKIGDLEVNNETFPTATLLRPEEVTAYSQFTGGLIFVDDITSKAVVNLNNVANNQNVASSGKVAIIGRYKDAGHQTELRVVDMRLKYDVAFCNLKLSLTPGVKDGKQQFGECLIEKNSNQTTIKSLSLVDCYIDMTGNYNAGAANTWAMIRDRCGSGPYAAPFQNITVDNCVIKLPSKKGTPKSMSTRVYYHAQDEDDTEPERTVSFTNNVIFSEFENASAMAISFVNSTGKKSPKMTFVFSNNTVCNMSLASGGVIYYDHIDGKLPVKSTEINNNLVFLSDSKRADKYTTYKFVVDYNKDGKGVVKCAGSNNWCGSVNCTNNEGSKATYSCWNLDGKNNLNTQEYNPFTIADYDLGYFPVDRTKVTNGAGASYETKKYCTWTAE